MVILHSFIHTSVHCSRLGALVVDRAGGCVNQAQTVRHLTYSKLVFKF